MKNSTIKNLLFVACLAMIAIFSSGCEEKIEIKYYGSISGKVLDAETNLPLSNVSITTSPATDAIVTDGSGSFMIETIEEGSYTITAKKSGYQTTAVSVAVTRNETTNVTILMPQLPEDTTGSTSGKLIGSPVPADQATGQGTEVLLQWAPTEEAEDFNLTYDVYLYESGSVVKKKVASAITDTFLLVEDLKFSTTYFWQVVALENGVQLDASSVFSFSTVGMTDNRYVFARETNNNFEIYSSDTSANSLVRLTEHNARDWNPQLSPILDKIAFTSNRNGDYHIYTMDRDGSNVRKVTSLPVEGNHNDGKAFAWSPDGGKLLYSRFDRLYTINRDGTGAQVIAVAPAGRHFGDVDWTSVGNRIVVQTVGTEIYDAEIYIMDADGSNMQLLVANDPGRTDHPVFSLNGQRILFTHDVSGFNSPTGRQLDSRIFMLDLTTMALTDLSANKPAGTNDLMPEFSPDGAQIIFVNTNNTGMQQSSIYMMDTGGGTRTLLFENATMPHAE